MPRRKKLIQPAPVVAPAPTSTSQVHPLVMEAARGLAGGDMRRVQLVSATEVVVR